MGKISQFLQAVKAGLVTDVPPEYQACESCRQPECNSERAANCLDRQLAENQEKKHREKDKLP